MITVMEEKKKTTVHLVSDIQKKYSVRMMTKYILKEIPIKKLLPSDLHYEKR